MSNNPSTSSTEDLKTAILTQASSLNHTHKELNQTPNNLNHPHSIIFTPTTSNTSKPFRAAIVTHEPDTEINTDDNATPVVLCQGSPAATETQALEALLRVVLLRTCRELREKAVRVLE